MDRNSRFAQASRWSVESSRHVISEEDSPSSTLRARLQRNEPKEASGSPESLSYPDIYDQFRACFTDSLAGSKPKVAEPPITEPKDPTSQLMESYAQAGTTLHGSATERLLQVHASVEAKIAQLKIESSEALSHCDYLYSHIAYPLSSTVCHNDDHPHATITVHLANLKAKISAGQDQLRKLGEEWDICAHTEQDIWMAINGGDRLAKQGTSQNDAKFARAMVAFKDEAERIVQEKCRILADIEKEHIANVQAETLKIMQTFMTG